MAEFLVAIVIMLLGVGALGIGLAFGRGPLKGSCGGMACLKDVACEGCPNRKPGAGA
ncbi:MAG: hypothetical protein Q4G26_02720 [Paracoccus sp. (in: a-proteobacteria)]|nr:hypothetical protein [Paracoccus sp. (in: a-proteobacteria)]